MRQFGGTPIACCKLHSHNGMIWGCAGNSDESMMFADWVRGGQQADDKPKVDELSVLMIKHGKILYYTYPHLYPIEIDRATWAVGSGADYALGAMAMGADALQAIAVASELDVNTGLGVDSMEFLDDAA
jgi:ATP-dependent protease HslVU (ClpYQ) peptidase subunit